MSEIKKGIVKKIQNMRDSVLEGLKDIEADLENHSKLLNIKGKQLVPYRDDTLQSFETFWSSEKAGGRLAYCYKITEILKNKTEEEMNKFVMDIFEKAEKVHQENLEIIEHNKKVIKVISDFLTSLGLSAQRRVEHKIGRKTSSYYSDSYWLQEIKSLFPIADNAYHDAVNWKNEFLKTIGHFWQDKKRKEKEERALEERQQLLNEAVKYLIEHGKEIGVDFNANDAIEMANKLATELLIQEYIKIGEYMPFSGDDSCENCKGWKPGEHRCDCGNRRVSFETDFGSTFKEPRVYPVAY